MGDRRKPCAAARCTACGLPLSERGLDSVLGGGDELDSDDDECRRGRSIDGESPLCWRSCSMPLGCPRRCAVGVGVLSRSLPSSLRRLAENTGPSPDSRPSAIICRGSVAGDMLGDRRRHEGESPSNREPDAVETADSEVAHKHAAIDSDGSKNIGGIDVIDGGKDGSTHTGLRPII